MFRLVKILNGRTNQAEPVKLATTASESYSVGEALVLSGGALTKCGATEKPTYIAAADYTAPAAEQAPLTAYPVSDGMIFECPVGAAPTSLHIGDKVTLATDGQGVTATTASGVATVWDLAGAAASGDKILVTF